MNLTISSFTEEMQSTKADIEVMSMSKNELIDALKEYKAKFKTLKFEKENLVFW